MSMLIFDQHPLVIDKKLAKVIGLNQSIVLQQVHYWLEKNKKARRNFHEGRYWTYNTIDEWKEEFDFWSKETVRRTFKKLRDLGFIIVDNFNLYQLDRTLWYTIDYDKLQECIGSICNNVKDQNDSSEDGNLTLAIPETSTETTTEIYNQSVSQDKDTNIRTDGLTDIEKELEKIERKCELYSIDEDYRKAVSHAIKLLLLDVEKNKRVKIGSDYYPIELVRKDLEKLNFFVVEHGVNKFKEATDACEIRNPIQYLKACIYNAIHEIDIDVDCKVRANKI